MNCLAFQRLTQHLHRKAMVTPFFATASPSLVGLLLMLLAPLARSQSYTFTTLAGTPGASGTNDGIDGGAQFGFPAGVVADKAGHVYVADFLNHAIRQMTPEGTNWVVTTIAGLPGLPGYADGTNTDARFNRPAGIAIDALGNLFVAERYNHTIRLVTPLGTNWVVSTVAGTAGVTGHQDGTNTQAQFYLPSGIAVDPSNRLYVADTGNFTIREIVASGTNWVVSTLAGTALNYGSADGANGQAQFNYPYGIALNPAGNLYIADWGNNEIRQITQSGADWVVTTIAGSITPGTADGLGGLAGFNSPTGVAVDGGGNLFVADQGNNSIRKIAPAGSQWMVSTLAGQPLHPGSTDGVGTNALFKKPWGIAVDTTGTQFVADYGNSTIRAGFPPPELQIMLSGSQVVLTWPASTSGYVLQTTTALDNLTPWVAVTNGIVLLGLNFVLTNPIEPGTAVYRLSSGIVQP